MGIGTAGYLTLGLAGGIAGGLAGDAMCPEGADRAWVFFSPCRMSAALLGGLTGIGVGYLLDLWWRDDSQAAMSPALVVGPGGANLGLHGRF
ncbi:hypothetical protein [Myxococcus sp. RHSTA-1-4]|uniref:hypothetical protein n=1 Tax=Myxococcus sp. RHSTA-1-4 TaxID=2874601 RepID=UPI001CBDB1EF|nr:hypothetical protein [Myxococcus sp. RHSTA-1-4]MBZ4416703.1 hypothetical protein [Myxococcus sp. RHSTA-1-4]